MLYPIIPQSSLNALKIFNIKEKEIKFSTLDNHNYLKANTRINKIDILFKKLKKKMIDSHCHLDHEPLISNLDQILDRAKEVGINKILTICTTLDSFIKIKEIIKKDKMIYGTYGIHPHETKNNKINSKLIIEEINNNKKIIGIGETGLDFFYNHSDKKDQINSFEEHIKAAIELNMPLIVHSRNAENETFDILNQFKKDNLKILMHCFTGSKDFAKDS